MIQFAADPSVALCREKGSCPVEKTFPLEKYPNKHQDDTSGVWR